MAVERTGGAPHLGRLEFTGVAWKEHMTDTTTPQSTDETPIDPVDRVLSRADARAGARISSFTERSPFGGAQALQDEATIARPDTDGEQWDREERAALRRVPGLSTELEDVTEVEYRQLRLENVVLVGVHPQGEQELSLIHI